MVNFWLVRTVCARTADSFLGFIISVELIFAALGLWCAFSQPMVVLVLITVLWALCACLLCSERRFGYKLAFVAALGLWCAFSLPMLVIALVAVFLAWCARARAAILSNEFVASTARLEFAQTRKLEFTTVIIPG